LRKPSPATGGRGFVRENYACEISSRTAQAQFVQTELVQTERAMRSKKSDYHIDELTARAFAAWFKECKRISYADADQPANSSGRRKIDGRDYVVLENARGVMAVYRVRTDGVLKRLKRWPEELAA
jgi:hypothetical protein